MKRIFITLAMWALLLNQLSAQESWEDYVDLSGFVESRLGFRTDDNPNQKDYSIGEFRLQLDAESEFDSFTLNMVADFVLDPVSDQYTIDLDTGEGVMDFRQLNVIFSPLDYLDIKLGRQILTWGTGDLVFINDLFAKDWNSFLLGRDEEYLKAPTDAVKTSWFLNAINIDLIYVPNFGADRYVDGQHLSFYDRSTSTARGRNNPLDVDRPNSWFEDDEVALRIYRSAGAFELAAYFYSGFWKSPAGQNPSTGRALFPDLDVFGASLRGPILGGIFNIELGYYDSEDGAAKDPNIRNDEFRLMLGFEQEIATELTLGLQYSLERKLDYRDYVESIPDAAIVDDEDRHLFTVRLSKLLMQQDLKISLFNFYSPSDKDGFVRANISYKLSDELKIEGGANLFYGEEPYTIFGQFKDDNNIYAAIRYEF